MFLFYFSVVLGIFIQVVSQELSNDNKVFLVVEIVNHFQQIFLVQVIAVANDKPEQLDFVNRLIKVIFVIFDDFHADHLLSMDVVALDCL